MIRALTLLSLLLVAGCGDDDQAKSKQPPQPSAPPQQPQPPSPPPPPARPAGGPLLEVVLHEVGPVEIVSGGGRTEPIDSLDQLPAALARFPEAGPAASIVSGQGYKDPHFDQVKKALAAAGFKDISVEIPKRAAPARP